MSKFNEKMFICQSRLNVCMHTCLYLYRQPPTTTVARLLLRTIASIVVVIVVAVVVCTLCIVCDYSFIHQIIVCSSFVSRSVGARWQSKRGRWAS